MTISYLPLEYQSHTAVSIGNGHSYLPGFVLLLFYRRALTEGAVGDFRIVAFPYREGGVERFGATRVWDLGAAMVDFLA